jgi:hypothetical protein
MMSLLGMKTMNNITVKIFYPRLIFAIGVMFDTIITSIGMYFALGKEMNPLWTWIQPPMLMSLLMFASSMFFIPLMFCMYERIPKEKRNSVDILLTVIGILRFSAGCTWFFV